MRAVLDTNVLVYDTFEDSVFHDEARRLLDSLDAWVIPIIVLYEYVWLMRSLGVDLDDVAEKVWEYAWDPKARVVSGGREAVRWALAVLREEGRPLSRFNDKVVLAVAQSEGLPLASFDERLRRQAVRLDTRVLPETL